mgnify:CR=1 FL=1
MSGTDFIGEIAQGALAARAVEPDHGEARDADHTHETACLNCGTILVGRHCHQCGQAAHVHKTLSAFFHDLLHGVFHFEGKVWRTLPLLAWRPGRLTRQYIDGRRASYVSPIALFLFVVFLTFAVFNLLGSPIAFNNRGSNQGFEQGMDKAEQEAVQGLAAAEQKLAAAKAGQGGDPVRLQKQVDEARGALRVIRAARGGQCAGRQAMSVASPADTLMQRLRDANAPRLDSVGWHYIETLAARIGTQPGPVQRLLQDKLQRALIGMQARMAAGNPPTAMQMLGLVIQDWAAQGFSHGDRTHRL